MLAIAGLFLAGVLPDATSAQEDLSIVGDPSTGAVTPFTLFVETFDDGNEGRWSFFGNPDNPIEIIETTGGNPEAFLHSTCSGGGCLDTFAPQPRTQLGVESVFTGNYRARAIGLLSVDLAVFGPDFIATGDRPLTIMLRNDNGTPEIPSDDLFTYRVGPRNIPSTDGRWKSYRFRIPSSEPLLPRGWVVPGWGTSGDPDADWNRIITDVDQVIFFCGDPELFYLIQQWDIGIDNAAISRRPGSRR